MDEEKKPLWKKILITIGTFFAGIITFIFARHISNRRGSSEVRDNIERATDLNQSARNEVESAQSTVNELRTNIDAERQNVEQCLDILQSARERAEKRKD